MSAAADNASDSGSEHEHWPDSPRTSAAASNAPYPPHFSYRPPSPAAPKVLPDQFQPQVIMAYPQQPQPMLTHAYPQYTYAPQQPQVISYPAQPQVYYSFPPQPPPVQVAPQPIQAATGPAYYVYQSTTTEAAPAPVPAKREAMAWKGRTKAQVEEDNMVIAAKEGAYDKRKVVPVGIKDDQMIWCVEEDGSHTLRLVLLICLFRRLPANDKNSMFVSIKELKGEWKKDPRFEDSYFFVREKIEVEDAKEEVKETKKKKKGKKGKD